MKSEGCGDILGVGTGTGCLYMPRNMESSNGASEWVGPQRSVGVAPPTNCLKEMSWSWNSDVHVAVIPSRRDDAKFSSRTNFMELMPQLWIVRSAEQVASL